MIRVRGIGPHYYWGVEWHSTSKDKSLWSYAWLQETNPPWRRGDGHRIRIGNKELHFGVCTEGTDPELVLPTEHSDPAVAADLAKLYVGGDHAEAAGFDA